MDLTESGKWYFSRLHYIQNLAVPVSRDAGYLVNGLEGNRHFLVKILRNKRRSLGDFPCSFIRLLVLEHVRKFYFT